MKTLQEYHDVGFHEKLGILSFPIILLFLIKSNIDFVQKYPKSQIKIRIDLLGKVFNNAFIISKPDSRHG